MHPAVMRFALLLAVAAPGGSVLAQGSRQMPMPVVRWMQAYEADCRSQSGRLVTTDTPIMEADFNGDRQSDYVASEGMFQCRDRRGQDLFAGNYGRLGPEVTFLMSSPSGHREIAGFGVNPYELKIEQKGNRDVLVITPSHNYFGDVKRIVWAWNGRQMEVTERRNGKGQMVDAEGRVMAARSSAAPATTSPPAAQSTSGFAVTVELSPAAQQWYARRKDRPVLLAIYQGPPKRGTPANLIHPAEDVVVAGEERTPLPVAGGMVRVPGAGLKQDLARWIQGEPEVGLLVGQARNPQSSMDSERFLECTPDTNLKLSVIRVRGARLRCGPPAY